MESFPLSKAFHVNPRECAHKGPALHDKRWELRPYSQVFTWFNFDPSRPMGHRVGVLNIKAETATEGLMPHRFASIVLLLMLCTLAACAQRTAPAPLDEEALKANLVQLFNSRGDKAASTPEAGSGLRPQDLRIEAVKAVSLGPNTYYAVKIGLAEPKAGPDMGFPLTTVVDPSGSLVFGSVIDLARGEEAILSQAPEVTRLDFPESVQPETFLTGSGRADIVFVADPFCPYCRQGYTFLLDHLDLAARVRIAFCPLTPSNGSAVAAWVMDYARARDIRAREVLDFCFSELRPIPPVGEDGERLTPEEGSLAFLEQFRERFPELLQETDGDLKRFYELLVDQFALGQIEAQKALNQAGFSAVPVFVVDGETIQGMDAEALGKALPGAEIGPWEEGQCGENQLGDCGQ